MEYSITSLAKKTRITGRTLRHYDQIGLLKPSIRMTNGKRVYSDEQFMRLCEIVFFKRVGIGLPKIKEIFHSRDCSKAAAAALTARKQALVKEIKKLQHYAASIDTVLPQYKNCTLNQKERLEKFRSLQNTIKEVEEIQIKEFGKDAFEKARGKIEALSEEQIDAFADKSNKLMNDAVKAVEHELDPSSKEVQEIIKRYYDLLAEYNSVTEEIFLKLRDSVLNQSEYYAAYHPKFPEFLYQAMGIFAASAFPDRQKNKRKMTKEKK
jgi:DNA-binding transcriptional MerR regulator